MSSYTLPLLEAQCAFASVLPFAAKNDVVPAICVVHVTTEGHVLTTDRYAVGRYKLDPKAETYNLPLESFTMPRDAAEWIAKIAAKDLQAHPSMYSVILTDPDDRAAGFKVEVTRGDGGGTLSEHTRSFYIDFSTNFPPVDRLFPPSPEDITDHTGETAYNAEHVLKFCAAAKVIWGTRKGTDQVLRMRSIASAHPTKPGPTYITIGDRFDGLLQPQIILR